MPTQTLVAVLATLLAFVTSPVMAKTPPRDRPAVTTTPISAVQGNDIVSPVAGSPVTIEGIVTARTADGFFVQSPDAQSDGDPATSEGLYVHLGTAPGPEASVGHRVQVTGLVDETVPAAFPHQMPLTRMVSPSTHTVLATGQALPAPVALDQDDFPPDMDVATLEPYEGMRVAFAPLVVVGPGSATIDESLRTAVPTGVLHAMVYTGQARSDRPFREPGLPVFDANPVPAGKTLPLFDGNPQTLRIDSTGQPGAAPLDLGFPDRISGAVGVLSYADGAYTLLPDPAAAIVTTPAYRGEGTYGNAPDQFRLMWLDLGRLFDASDDPSRAEPVLAPAAYQARLAKLARALCNSLGNPDIIAVSGAENLQVLQDLAGVAQQNPTGYCPNLPDYQAILVEGQAADGLDIGLLVSRRIVDGLNPRVEVLESQVLFAASSSAHPGGGSEILFQTPPLMARVRVTNTQGGRADLTVVATGMQGIAGIDDMAAGSNGWSTAGARIMTLRARQATTLAGWIQALQQSDPDEALAVLGGFEAHAFNDGRVDTLGILSGTPAPAAQTWLALPSPVSRPLTNLGQREHPTLRFNAIRDGHAEALDHILVNDALLEQFAVQWRQPRINAEYPATQSVDTSSNFRTSDRDPLTVAMAPAAFSTADTSVHFLANPILSPLQEQIVYFDVRNAGPDLARSLELLMHSSLAPADYNVSTEWPDWTCGAPQVDGTGSVAICRQTGLPATEAHGIKLTIPANPSLGASTQTFSAVLTGAHSDPDTSNNADAGSVMFEDRTDVVASISQINAAEELLPGQTGGFSVALTQRPLNAPGDVAVEFTIDASAAEVNINVSNGQLNCATGVDIAPRRSRWTCRVPSPNMTEFANFSINFRTALGDGGRTVGLHIKATPARTESTPADNEASAMRQVSDKVDLVVLGMDGIDEPANLEDNLFIGFMVYNERRGVVRNARLEFLVDLPAAVLGGLEVVPNHTSVTWTCDAPTVVTSTRSRVVCRAPPLIEQPDHVLRSWYFRTYLVPPLRPGLPNYDIVGSVTVSSDSDEQVPADNSGQENWIVDQTTDLRLSGSAETPQVIEPGLAQFRVHVGSVGSNQPRNARVRLELDALFSAGEMAVTNAYGQSVSCVAATATAGHSAVSCPVTVANTLRLTVPTRPDLAGKNLVLSAVVENDLVEAVPADNTGTAAVQVIARADLCVVGLCSQTLPPQERIIAGGANEVVHELRNLGPSTARAMTVTVEAALPASHLSANIGTGTCAGATDIGGGFSRIVCALGDRLGQSFGPGVTLRLGLDTTGINAGTLPYRVIVASDTPDPHPANNHLERSPEILPAVDLSVAMGVKSRPYPGAQYFMLELAAQGPATSALSELVLTIDAPNSQGYAAISADGWGCSLRNNSLPGRYEYHCLRYAALPVGLTDRFSLRVNSDLFTQIGTTVRVSAEHRYPVNQPAGDRNAANNTASAEIRIQGRHTRPAPVQPTPAYGPIRREPAAAPSRKAPANARAR